VLSYRPSHPQGPSRKWTLLVSDNGLEDVALRHALSDDDVESVAEQMGRHFFARSAAVFSRFRPFVDIEQVLDEKMTSPINPLDEDKDERAWTAAVQSELLQRQFPKSCKNKRFLVFHFDRAYWGMMANLNYVTLVRGLTPGCRLLMKHRP
jgi:hypothetical protein